MYETLAQALADGGEGLFGLEGREHTAQVEQQRRQWREWRFRWGHEDQEKIAANKDLLRDAGEPDVFLPTLFCSPTMELGVDISALNAVYLRNVPPTPANYAQRSGRAGRSGQAALIVTYCAAQSPHDQNYFSKPQEMVSGIVRPPALELANRDLIESHLHAIWLAESQQNLQEDIPHVLDLANAELDVKNEIKVNLTAEDLAPKAAVSMRRVLDSVGDELSADKAPWAANKDEFVNGVAADSFDRFSKAFGRWRQLYQSAHTQLADANRKSEMHGLGAKERNEAKQAQMQATDQLALLERAAKREAPIFPLTGIWPQKGFFRAITSPDYRFTLTSLP